MKLTAEVISQLLKISTQAVRQKLWRAGLTLKDKELENIKKLILLIAKEIKRKDGKEKDNN